MAQPIVGISAAADGTGYRLVASDGGVFDFGRATFHGSIVGMAASPDGTGYWLVASDGGVFTFGTASFHGSLGGQKLSAPVVAIVGSPSGGYQLIQADGTTQAFG